VLTVDVLVSTMRVADEYAITDKMNSWRPTHVGIFRQHLF